MFIQTEETPNPSTLKFIPGKVLLENGTQEFKSKQSAKSNSLASMLFEDENVDGVFIGKDFITITKSNEVNWESLKPSILSKIHDFLSSGKKVESEKNKKKTKENYNKKDLGIVKQIKDLLEERIKPAVAQDGGDISFVKFDNGWYT